jgi:hypothetical protein
VLTQMGGSGVVEEGSQRFAASGRSRGRRKAAQSELSVRRKMFGLLITLNRHPRTLPEWSILSER